MITGRVRRWLDLPPCATAHFMPLPSKLLGLDLILPSMLFERCQISTSITLSKSKDPSMLKLYSLTGSAKIDVAKSKREVIKFVNKNQEQSLVQKLDALEVQSLLFKSLRDSLSQKELESWSKHTVCLTPSVSNFARKALIRCLPTNSNLNRWGRSQTDSCPACGSLETENHVLNNCSVSAQQGRYTWRHDAVLKYLASNIQSLLSASDKLFVDLPGYDSPADLFIGIRPDIVVIHNNKASALELTCCYERNLVGSKAYKVDKYSDIKTKFKLPMPIQLYTVEITSLGFLQC